MNWTPAVTIGLLVNLWALTPAASAADRPNFLWVTSEDNSPYLGCYGDSLAFTPNLDRLATEGIRYRNFFANAPVCSAARSTLIAGMHGFTLGLQHHRSSVSIPAGFKLYPQVLREAGYYCTNNVKTDYNVAKAMPGRLWDESSAKAHYKNRGRGQPFFAVFNFTSSHESQVAPKPGKTTFRVPPEKVVLPPYHPNEPDIRRDWANYYDQITVMDAQVGKVLDELREAGLADSTIVFYYGDHGGALPRGKRNIHDSGTRVPLIVRIPAQWADATPAKAGEWADELASFVDLPPTVFRLAGIESPKNYQGQPFLGRGRPAPANHVLLHRGRMDERYDFVRSVRTKDSQFIRNYSPHRPQGQHYSYPFQVQPSMRAWFAAFEAGRCNDVQAAYWRPKAAREFYDVASDPFQIRNLWDDPTRVKPKADLQRLLRDELIAKRDTGFIPEGMFAKLAGDRTIYDYAQGSAYPIERVVDLADQAVAGVDPGLIDHFQKLLSDPHPVVRYWAATGCLLLKDRCASAKPSLLAALADDMGDVRVVAAEALGYIGETDEALKALQGVIREGNDYEKLAALNALDNMVGAGSVPVRLEQAQAIVKDLKLAEPLDRVQKYILNGRR